MKRKESIRRSVTCSLFVFSIGLHRFDQLQSCVAAQRVIIPWYKVVVEIVSEVKVEAEVEVEAKVEAVVEKGMKRGIKR